ncbi:hypothetical protein QAD02_001211 [Eretmocerus hayati]|uniref:Uncharacterized protein n=1 Tax=Eretmocerus hayati TaxID=131215 RepID=A0ACC2NFS7_9HYME|nr:hypothetical protein QAD02_001211 [Eretmocerus hayati]
MQSSQTVILASLVLVSMMILISPTNSTPGISLKVKVEHDKTTILSVYPKLIDGVKLLTAQCKTMGVYTGVFLPDIVCKIAMPPIRDSSLPTKECRVSLADDVLDRSERGRLIGFPLVKKFQMEYLGNDKVITKWSEKFQSKLFTKVMIVNMLDCTTNRLKYSEDLKMKYLQSNLILHKDGFEVFVADKNLCGSKKCRISYDTNGTRVDLPKSFQTELYVAYTTAVTDQNGTQNFYLLGFDKSKENLILSYINSSGVETKISKFSNNKYDQIPSSDAYGKYGMCYMIDHSDDVQCSQFDANANTKLNSKINLGRNYTLLGVHNLKYDGLILVSSSCKNGIEGLLECKNFVITSVRESGKWQTFSLASNKFSCDLQSVGATQSHVFDSSSEVCIYLHNLYKHKIDNSDENVFGYDFNSVCFPRRLVGKQ